MALFLKSLLTIIWIYIWWAAELSWKGAVIKDHYTFWFKRE